MGLKQSKDGYYRTSIVFEGKRYQVAGKTEAEAYKKAGKLRSELESGRRKKRQGVTLATFAKEWLETYHGTDTENDKRYERIVKGIIVPELGAKKVRDITESDLQRFLNEHSDYSFSQLSKIRMTLKQMFHKARKNHLIVDDPAEDLVLPDCKKGTHRSLTPYETFLLLKAANERPDGLYMKIMLYCGLRPQEVDVLQWKYVDLKKKVIYVRQALKHKTTVIGAPKSDAGERDVPIPDILLNELQAVSAGPDEFVISRNGKHLTESSRYRLWKAIYKRMDILAGAVVYRNEVVKHAIDQDLDLYCLRHTYCTNLQSSGVALNVAKELMGHDDVTVTANIYTHAVSDNLHDAIGSLGTFMAEEAVKQAEEEKKRLAEQQAMDDETRKAEGRAAKLRAKLHVLSA